MNPEEKHLLEEIHALARDNHRMLRSVRRHQLLVDFGKFTFFLLLLGLAAYYYFFSIQPAVDRFKATGVVDIPAMLFGFPTSAELEKLIESYKAGQKP